MKVIGHRGFKAEYPENTLTGFREVIAAGIQCIEMDIHMTSDEKVVVAHDPVVSSRLFRKDQMVVKGKILLKELTFEELSQFTCGETRSSRTGMPRQLVENEKVPLLSEVLKLSKDIYWCIEIKYRDNGQYPDRKTLVERVLDVVNEADCVENSILFSFDIEILKLVKKMNPRQAINYLYCGTDLLFGLGENWDMYLEFPNWLECEKTVNALQADAFSPSQNLVRLFPGWKKYFAKSKRKCKMFTWTSNDEKHWRQFIKDDELDGIITDEPLRLNHLMKNN